jgi:hypothetical protein
MIGDAKARGASRTGPTPYAAKNSKGRSHKTIAPGRDDKFDSGDSDTKGPAHRATKGMRPGTGGTDKQNPGKQRARKILVDDWCLGKRESYVD